MTKTSTKEIIVRAIKTVRINDCSHGGCILSAITRDLRQAGGYYIVPADCKAKVDIYIEVSSINKGGDDENEAATIYSYDDRDAEKMKGIVAKRFISSDMINISSQPRIERARWREREVAFLDYMRQFEGVDFT